MFSDNDRHKKSPQSLCHAGFLYFTGRIRIIIWWSWRELNPRPKFLHTILTHVKTMNYEINHDVSFT